MKILHVVFLALLTQVAAPQLPASGEPATVRGTIRRSDTAGPLISATVELRRADGTTPQTYTATTAGDGSFVLSNIRPGDYRLAAWRAGFLRTEYGQRRMGGTGVTLSLAAAQILEDVQVTVTLPGVISGRITDLQGDPLGAADIRVFTRTYQNGQRVLQLVQSDVSNDLGEYRLFGLVPAQYFLSVTPSNTSRLPQSLALGLASGDIQILISTVLASPGTRGSVYVPTFYPGTTDARSAAPLNLAAGANLLGVDFSIAPLKTYHVSGNVPGGGAHVTLAPLDPVPAGKSSQLNSDAVLGPFTFDGVTPGPYLVIARSGDLSGSVRIEVRDMDLDGVTVALGTGVIVPVHVSFDNHVSLESDPDFEKLNFGLAPDPPIAGIAGDTYSPFPNGLFGFELMVGEGYKVSLGPGRLPDIYIRSARMGNRDVLNDGLVYNNEADSKIEIVIGTKPANLTGSVVDSAKRPSINTTVVLVPDGEARHRADAYRATASDAAGRFQMTTIPPGDYTLFAWEDVEAGIWQDPDFIKEYERRGVRVHLADGSRENVTVQIIPAQ